MRNKLVILAILLTIVTILSGCISGKQPKNNVEQDRYITIKYIEKNNPIITDEDFPDFKLMDRIYYVSRENTSLTLQTEGSHGSLTINDSDNVPEGYRTYGVSEAYNSSERYILLQYKVFDNDERLNDSINMTVFDYIKKGFKHRLLSSESYNVYKGRVFILESNVTNRTDANVTIVLFEYDTIFGKIGVQDLKDKSLNESLKILDRVFEKLKTNTKEVKAARIDTLGAYENIRPTNRSTNRSYGIYNRTNK